MIWGYAFIQVYAILVPSYRADLQKFEFPMILFLIQTRAAKSARSLPPGDEASLGS